MENPIFSDHPDGAIDVKKDRDREKGGNQIEKS